MTLEQIIVTLNGNQIVDPITFDDQKETLEGVTLMNKQSEPMIPSCPEGHIASPSTSFEIFKPRFHLLKQPKKKKSVNSKKRKIPGVFDLNISLANVFSDSLFTSDNDLLRENDDKIENISYPNKKFPVTPSNSPSSPITMDEDALDTIYSGLESNLVNDGVLLFDQSMDDSLDSFSADYLRGFTIKSDGEERLREYWNYCYGDESYTNIISNSDAFVDHVPLKSCFIKRTKKVASTIKASRKQVHFGIKSMIEYDSCCPVNTKNISFCDGVI